REAMTGFSLVVKGRIGGSRSLDLLRLVRAGLDRNLFRCCRLRQRHRNFEHAVFKLSGYLLRIDSLRERECALKSTVGSLTVVIVFLFYLVRTLTLTFERQGVIED